MVLELLVVVVFGDLGVQFCNVNIEVDYWSFLGVSGLLQVELNFVVVDQDVDYGKQGGVRL